jgi:apolipoprotein N-acyltransferase
VLAALSLLGLGAVLTTAIFYIVLLGSDWLLYTALGITKPTQWSAADMVRELVLKGVFAAAVGIAFSPSPILL